MAYAEKFGWTPQQVDQLTVEQDDWLLPVVHAIESQRAYDERKRQEAADRAAGSQQNRAPGRMS